MRRMIPFESMPGIPRLFLAFVRGEASAFFPDPPTLDSVVARAREVGARSGGHAVIAAGQQAGLLGGPLLSLTKAAATARLASTLAERGVPCRGVFWVASEDHDLNEVARTTLLLHGAPETIRLPVPAKNFQPAGTVEVPPEIADVFRRIAHDAPPAQEIVDRFARLWAPGRTYADAFQDTLASLLPPAALEWIDPLDEDWREKEIVFFRQAFARAGEVTAALDRADAELRDGGFSPPVTRAKDDFPAFVIEKGTRRRISWNGTSFSVHGHEETFSAEAMADLVSRDGLRPSSAALLRPVLQSHLFPVAAEILGPSELSYHAQSAALFPVFGLPRPVFLSRPHLLPRGARERRALDALGIAESDVFRAREAASVEPPPVSLKIQALQERLSTGLAALAPEVRSVDPTLEAVVAGTAEKLGHQIGRLREKVERAAERRDLERTRRLETIETLIAPGRAPADRVYGPLTYLLRFGEAFVPELSRLAECRTDGARFVDFE
jgi:bacillithiol biosynthesis cysteine-adding enzyme BshC